SIEDRDGDQSECAVCPQRLARLFQGACRLVSLYDILARCVLVQVVENRSYEYDGNRCSRSSELEVLRVDQFIITCRILDKRADSIVDICESENQYQYRTAEQDDALDDITPYDTFDSAKERVDDAEQPDNTCDEYWIDISNRSDGERREIDANRDPADVEEYRQDDYGSRE